MFLYCFARVHIPAYLEVLRQAYTVNNHTQCYLTSIEGFAIQQLNSVL